MQVNDPHAGKRFPRSTVVTAAFWQGCQNQQLLIQRCVQCNHLQFYPRSICTVCLSEDLEWKQASGRGRIWTYTVIRHPVSEAYADEVPYVLALIRLDEGPTMMSALIECDPESVESGMPVEVVFEQWSDTTSMPKFRPALIA